MLKKISYLVSASVIVTTLLGSSAYAVHEEDIIEVIRDFRLAQKQKLSQKPTTEEPTTAAGSVMKVVTGTLNPLFKVIGNGMRYGGDALRQEDDSVGTLMTNAFLSKFKDRSVCGTTVAEGSEVLKKQGLIGRVRKAVGNTIRCAGGKLSGETDTLERRLRQFWIERKETNPEVAMVSTACAFQRSPEIGGSEEIILAYNKFVNAWNSSSYTVPCQDLYKPTEYFVTGVIKGLIQMGMKSDPLQVMNTFDISLEVLPVTKAITAETLYPNENERNSIVPTTLTEALNSKRKEAFADFVEKIRNEEALRIEVNRQRREVLEQNNNNAQPLAAIEAAVDIGKGKEEAGSQPLQQQGDEGQSTPPSNMNELD